MSISVDDLVASLSSNHIGQEAIDLANLQTQLAQTLLYQSQQPVSTWDTSNAPCNTPIARTPSSSSWADPAWQRSRVRSSSVASASSARRNMHDREDNIMEESMDEDEEAVECLVSGSASPSHHRAHSYATAPLGFHGHGQGHGHGHTSPHTRAPHSHSHSHAPTYTHGYESMSTSPTQSSFASTDPFFAAVQASSNQTHQTPFLAHGWPSQQSPFFQPQTHGINGFPLQVDSRSRPRYVAAGCMDS